MASQVQICNIALGNIGGKASISSITENSREAIACNRVYVVCARALLRSHEWSFSKAYYTLNDLGSPPTFWDYRYSYPAECLKVRKILPAVETDDPVHFEVAAGDTSSTRVILTDQEDAEMCFTKDMDDPVQYPDDFILTLAWSIAASISLPLSGDRHLQTQAYQAYLAHLSSSTASDGGEATWQQRGAPDWISGRA